MIWDIFTILCVCMSVHYFKEYISSSYSKLFIDTVTVHTRSYPLRFFPSCSLFHRKGNWVSQVKCGLYGCTDGVCWQKPGPFKPASRVIAVFAFTRSEVPLRKECSPMVLWRHPRTEHLLWTGWHFAFCFKEAEAWTHFQVIKFVLM